MSENLSIKKRECAYGFSCAAMLQTPGLTAIDCPNRGTCGTIVGLDEEDIIRLQIARENQIIEEEFTKRQLALMLLSRRGNPQTTESLGIDEVIQQLTNQLSTVQNLLTDQNQHYIAPSGCEAHRYNVKRRRWIYWYNKLTSTETIFPAAYQEDPETLRRVKVVHLSKDSDHRNLEGRKGIERRNKMLKARTKLREAIALLQDIELDWSSEDQ